MIYEIRIINADDVKWIANCLQSTTNGCYCAAALIVEMWLRLLSLCEVLIVDVSLRVWACLVAKGLWVVLCQPQERFVVLLGVLWYCMVLWVVREPQKRAQDLGIKLQQRISALPSPTKSGTAMVRTCSSKHQVFVQHITTSQPPSSTWGDADGEQMLFFFSPHTELLALGSNFGW